MSVQDIFTTIKKEFESAITTAEFDKKTYDNGNKAKEALIRSQRLINYIHDFIKNEFISLKVNPQKIVPPLHVTKPEIKLSGFLKQKNQDICIVHDVSLIAKLMQKKPIPDQDIEKIISINVRSQLSSLSKNIDTLYERTFAEAFNLHQKYAKQCLGEVYLIPTHEYDDQAMLENRIVFKKVSKIENYINMFQQINNRSVICGDEHKYERICLLIIDFNREFPKVYNDIKSLIEDNLVPQNTKTVMDRLGIANFAKDLLEIYSARFDVKGLY